LLFYFQGPGAAIEAAIDILLIALNFIRRSRYEVIRNNQIDEMLKVYSLRDSIIL